MESVSDSLLLLHNVQMHASDGVGVSTSAVNDRVELLIGRRSRRFEDALRALEYKV